MELCFKDVMQSGNIKYIAYVDGSGDDGFSFSDDKGQGSSDCFTVAIFISDVEDIDHNISVLNECKKLSGHKDSTSELKYTKLRRHPNSEKVHDLIFSQIKGTVIIQNAFKRYHMSPDNKKYLTAICHSFPISKLQELYKDDCENVCVVIDRMKKHEQDGVIDGVKHLQENDSKISAKIFYMDSKDKNTPLIQIADFFSGMYRECFELVYSSKSGLDKFKGCNACFRYGNIAKARREPVRCIYKKRKTKIPNLFKKRLYNSSHLLYKRSNNDVLLYGINVFPLKLSPYFTFIDCNISQKIKTK